MWRKVRIMPRAGRQAASRGPLTEGIPYGTGVATRESGGPVPACGRGPPGPSMSSLLREDAGQWPANPGARSGVRPAPGILLSAAQRDRIGDDGELQDRVADADAILVAQLMALANPPPVDEGAVGAGQIPDEIALRAVHGDLGVLA